MTTYIYEPLDYDKAQIRVVHLPPALDDSEPIRISLQKATIPRSCLSTPLESDLEAIDLAAEESDVEKPDFIALSYVWGSPDDPQEVIVESAPEEANTISITRNLEIALRNIRFNGTDVVIWIDAICIDQGNLEERSHQVAFMDTIYTIAKSTLVWLGPEENDSPQALELLAYIGQRVEFTSSGSIERHPDAPPREPGDPILVSRPGTNTTCPEKHLRTLITFFERPWFTRLWIRQEIALANNAQVLCGRTKIDWIDLQNAAGWLLTANFGPSIPVELEERRAKINKAVWNVCEVNMKFLSYKTLRRDNVGTRFTDPRDTIYAVKRLLDTSDQELDVLPNYTLQTADVFMDVCLRIVERQGLAYFLESCELNSISVPNLPSWVPDWSKPATAVTNFVFPWSASGFISAHATYLGDGVLRVGGLPIDTIESVKDLYDPVGSETLRDLVINFDYIWRCYPGDNLINSPYDEKQTMMDAYCRTFTGGMFRDNWHLQDDGPSVITFDEAKEALKKVWSVREDWDGYEDSLEDPLVQKYLKKCGVRTAGRCFFTTKRGYVGLAPLGTEPGDIISVILGCNFPVVIRKDPISSAKSGKPRWKVVGVCYANGLMCGEAIYGSLPSHYRPVSHSKATDDELIFGSIYPRYALLDSRTNEFKTDPAALLEEFGIQPSAWSRKPHRLDVSVSALREAGVDLRAIFLV